MFTRTVPKQDCWGGLPLGLVAYRVLSIPFMERHFIRFNDGLADGFLSNASAGLPNVAII